MKRSSRMNLLAFHHAGGSPAAFAKWQRRLSSDIRVIPVELPDRSDGTSENPVSTEHFLLELTYALESETTIPYAIYGHSMGATIGFAFAMYQAIHKQRLPTALMVGAGVSPKSPLPVPTFETSRTGSCSQPMAESAVIAIKKENLSKDLILLDHVRAYCVEYFDRPAHFPIRVFTGMDDPLCPDPESWREVGSHDVNVVTVSGGHLFHRDAKFIEIVNQYCSELLSAQRNEDPAQSAEKGSS